MRERLLGTLELAAIFCAVDSALYVALRVLVDQVWTNHDIVASLAVSMSHWLLRLVMLQLPIQFLILLILVRIDERRGVLSGFVVAPIAQCLALLIFYRDSAIILESFSFRAELLHLGTGLYIVATSLGASTSLYIFLRRLYFIAGIQEK